MATVIKGKNSLGEQVWMQLSDDGELVTKPAQGTGLTKDAADRIEVGQAESTGDYVLANNNLPLRIDQENIGTGTQSYDAVTNSQDLSVSADGDVAIFQTKQYHPYYAGRAQQPEFTYINFQPETDVIKRIGYFSSSDASPYDNDFNGHFLESSDGTVKFVTTKDGNRIVTEQADWNEGYTTSIDWAKFQVTSLDFLYLGGTSIAVYQTFDGIKNEVLKRHHANYQADVIIGHPAQPIRAEIRSTGGAGSFKSVCANVSSSGIITSGYGLPVAFSSEDPITLAVQNTEYVLLALRKNSPNVEFFPDHVSIVSSAGATELHRWRLTINPTVSTGSLSYNNLNPETFMETAIGNGTTAVTAGTGYTIASGSGASRSSSDTAISRALRIGRTIAGVYDELVLSAEIYNNGQNLTADISGTII